MPERADRILVWDLPIRLFHWLLVLLLLVLGISGKFGGLDIDWSLPWGQNIYLPNMDVHMLAGQLVLTLVLFRLLWGVLGSTTARFSSFLKGPRAVTAYLLSMLRGRASLTAGHNPAGGLMVVFMLALLLLQCLTGLFASDELFSQGPLAHLIDSSTSARVTNWHGSLFNLLLAAIILHIAVNLYYLARGRHLIGAMLTGRKPISQVPHAVELRQRSIWLALLVLLVAGAGVWGLRFF